MSDLTLSLDLTGVNLQPEPTVAYAPRQLLTPLSTPGHFLLVIDNSSLEVFTTCPQSAYYKLVLRREAQAKNAALTFGGAIHEGLERLLWSQHQADEPDPEEQILRDKFYGVQAQDKAIVDFFTNHPTPLDEYRTVNNALAVLAAYRFRATLPDYQWTIQSDDKGPIIERAFELPLGVLEVNDFVGMPWLSFEEQDNLNDKAGSLKDAANYETLHLKTNPVFVSQIHVAWSGRIDAIAHCNNAIRVVDHKTTSIAGDQFVQDFQISNQVLGYVWAARQLWPDLAPSGFCLNAIHFKKPTGNGSITEPGPRGGPSALNFFRAYFDYSEARLNEWSTNCLAIVSDFIHCLVRDQFPRHTKWCFGKYGKCQYHDVCVQDDPAVRQNLILSDMFKPVTWNPTAGR